MVISRRSLHHALVLVVLCAFATGFLGPLLRADAFPKTHESYRYVMLAWHFTDALRDGVLYPRWLPALAGGYGYPTFVFYQPLFFYLAAAVGLVGGVSAAAACLLATWVAVVLGGLGAWLLGRRAGGPVDGTAAGLATAALFLVTPYLYVNFYVRGDLSELLAMLLTPYPVAGMLAVRDRVRADEPVPLWLPVGLGGALALVVACHPATALIFTTLAGLFGLGLLADARGAARQQLARWYASAAVLGLSLSAPYWATVFAMRNLVGDLHVVAAHPDQHVVQLGQLLSLQWGFGDPTDTGPADAMSVSLGAVHGLAACAGLVAGRRDAVVRSAFAVYLLGCLLMLPVSQPLWRSLPAGLQLIQFPWRALSVTAVFQLVCVLGVRPWSARVPFAWVLAALALAAAIVGGDQFQVNPETPPTERGLATLDALTQNLVQLEHRGFLTYANRNEFLPRTARFPMPAGPRDQGPLVVVDPGSAQALPGSTEHHLRYRLVATAPGAAVIQQYFFPGWEVTLDGQPVDAATLTRTLTPDGRISVPLPHAGAYTLEAGYSGPPGWGLRWTLATLGCLLAIGAMRWRTPGTAPTTVTATTPDAPTRTRRRRAARARGQVPPRNRARPDRAAS